MKIKYVVFLPFTILLAGCNSLLPRLEKTPTEIIMQYPDPILPDADPEAFGEDFFEGTFHSAPIFSAEGTQMWWAGEYSSATIFFSKLDNSTWSEPQVVQFTENITSYRDPFLSPDGSKFYFISEKEYPGSETGSPENIWMMIKTNDGWGEAQPLPESINSLELHWTISVDNENNLYFSAFVNGNWDLFVSYYSEKGYEPPQNLEMPLSSSDREFTPNIAPDGRYILFSRMPLNSDNPSLYISYRSPNGWSEPKKVENISYCISPIVTPDRKYVIYLSSPYSFAWRDTTFITELEP